MAAKFQVSSKQHATLSPRALMSHLLKKQKKEKVVTVLDSYLLLKGA